MPPKRAKKDEDLDSDEEFEESHEYKPKSKRTKGPATGRGSDDLDDESSEDEVTSRPTLTRGRSTRAAAQKATQVVSRVAKRDAGNSSDEEEEEEEEEEPVEEEPELETPFGLKWAVSENGTMHYLTSDEIKGSDKIVGFDMDGTLIDTKSKAKFPKSREDWKWYVDEVPKKLQELHDNGYKIVIFTNQAGVEKNHVKVSDLKGKVIDIIQSLNIPIQALIATHTDTNRKPNTTMWKFFEKNLNGGVAVDKSQSTFVGDAGGRPKEWKKGKKKDFSCSDRAFASNIGLTFKTPEEYFLGEEPATFEWDSIDPSVLLESITDDVKEFTGEEPVASDKQELIVLVGRPASGKSTFAKKHLIPGGYVHINQDTLKTKDKCIKAAREALNNGKSVVIDNTNPTIEVRRDYLALAKEKGIPARCYYFDLDLGLSHHLNFYREKIQGTRRVPDVGFNTYKAKFKEPTTEEGFAEVKKISFVPDFASEEHKQLFLERT